MTTDHWPKTYHALTGMALSCILLLVAAWTAPLWADETLELACETDRIRVVIDQPACDYIDPTLGPTFGPGGTCTGPTCEQPCQDPLHWLPPGERLLIHLNLTTEQ
jgi:hypothetical protein